ncbi:DNA cytosine methyltransferase [Chromobacterium haemolyticum]|nr:DNA cytosine methyltransferase [Chromobacterium haemolyticum]
MLDIGVHAALDYLGYSARTVGYVERDAYAASSLLARMDDQVLEPAPVWAGNLQDVRWERWAGCLDGIIAGFPCQPHSMAGNREGTEDDRWTCPEIVESIRLAGPGFAFLENVSGLRSSGGLDAVLEDVAALGMHAVWDSIRAADVGAGHQRERVFILAYRDSPWEQQQGRQQRNGWGWPANSSFDVADAGNTEGRAEVERGQQKTRAVAGRPGSAMGNAHGVGFGAMRHDQVGAFHVALHDQELADAGGQGLSVGLRRERERSNGPTLTNTVQDFSRQARIQANGPTSSISPPSSPLRLNPAFACWLMGWPWWWTNPGPISFAALEMALWRSRLRWHLSRLLGEQVLPDLADEDEQEEVA